VDDDPKIVDLVRLYLERDGYQVFTARDGQEALEAARQKHPDLIVLDLLLPRVDGLEVCRFLKGESEVPVIMLTAKSTEEDKILGLESGADDYITKPFSPRELVARVRAGLRRGGPSPSQAPSTLQYGDLVIDRRGHEVTLLGRTVELTPTEFKLLETLADEPGRAFSRLELLDRVFGSHFDGFQRTVDVHIKNLRKKIESDCLNPIHIKTVFGVGYKFNGAEGEGRNAP